MNTQPQIRPKTFGLIGGTSWSSTADYYRILNEETARRLGGLHSARLILASIDFADLEAAMRTGRWNDAADILKSAALSLEKAGADGILLCSNLIHKLYPDIAAATSLPVLHIGDAIASDIKARGFSTVALLGARPTMEEDFYQRRIGEKSGAAVIIPDAEDRTYINEAIFGRMCRNIYTDDDRRRFCSIIDGLKRRGAQGVVLGCTELPILLPEAPLPTFDSTRLHCLYALDWALAPAAHEARPAVLPVMEKMRLRKG